MKKFFLILLLFLPGFTYSQGSSAAIKLGYFDPSGIDGGFIIGYEGSRYIDAGLSFGWSIDWFHRNYIDKRVVNDFNDLYGGVGGSINELRAKTNLHDFPFMINLTGKFPASPFIKIFLSGAIGAELLLVNYRNFQNPEDDEFKAAFGFNWRLGLGALYEIGPRSDVFIEFNYHYSQPSWEYEMESTGQTRVYERIFDMSGLMTRVGVRFYY